MHRVMTEIPSDTSSHLRGNDVGCDGCLCEYNTVFTDAEIKLIDAVIADV